MTIKRLKEGVRDNLDDLEFDYNGKHGWVTEDIHDYIVTFQAWWEEVCHEYSTVDELFEAKVFDGKSLIELNKIVEIHFG